MAASKKNEDKNDKRYRVVKVRNGYKVQWNCNFYDEDYGESEWIDVDFGHIEILTDGEDATIVAKILCEATAPRANEEEELFSA